MRHEQEKIFIYEELESLGINKKDLKTSDTEALLAGRKTDLMNFSVEDTTERRNILECENIAYTANNGKLDFEGKVQLQKYMTVENTEENKKILNNAKLDFEELKGDKLKLDTNAMQKVAIELAVLISPVTTTALALVPKMNEIKNDLGLSEKDIKILKQGEVIEHNNAKNERVLVQLDKDTNNLVSVRSNDISIPNKIAGQEITQIQKEQLINGQKIQVKDTAGQTVYAKIDLNEKTGLILKDENGQKITIAPEQKTDIKSKQEFNMKKTMSDTERLYVVSKLGVAGVENIHPDNPQLKEDFLQKYNLSEEVKKYNYFETERQNDFRSDSYYSARINDNNMNKADERVKEIAVRELDKIDKGIEYEPIKENIKLTTDKEKLQFVATFGFEGLQKHPEENKIFNDIFLVKYNLKNDYYAAQVASLGYNFSENYEQEKKYEAEIITHSNRMKDTAISEISRLEKSIINDPIQSVLERYNLNTTNELDKKVEQKQTPFKMKM